MFCVCRNLVVLVTRGTRVLGVRLTWTSACHLHVRTRLNVSRDPRDPAWASRMLLDMIVSARLDLKVKFNGPRYAKRSLMSWVVVIPKEGWAGNPNRLSRCHTKGRIGGFWCDTDSVDVIPKEGLAGNNPSFWYDNDRGLKITVWGWH